ncbi:hypothetical protein WSM22_07940 [Cytophagales bacterium WSM2-2]|nr:hypothetical protein WSM22_07940 [Cytophagales bacterium WSM2-2]
MENPEKVKVYFKYLSVLTVVVHSLTAFAQKVVDFKNYEQVVPGSSYQLKMVPVPFGNFLMGSNDQEKDRNSDEGPQKSVSISAFWMSAYEVSRDAFDVFYKDESISQNDAMDAVTRPSPQYIDFSLGMGKEGGYPVNSLSQYAALMYCRWLFSKTGIFYRLPTEAEWEYASRAGSTTSYFFGNEIAELDKYAWYSANSENKFHRSGQKLPNAWGLYDMLGNVSEWTLDHYDEKMLEHLPDKSIDPFAPVITTKYPKVVKGGGYTDGAGQLRIANRMKSDPAWNKRDPQIPKSKWWLTEASSVGFRIVRPLKQPTSEEANAFFKKYLGK